MSQIQVPKGWKLKKLIGVGEIITGSTPSKKIDEYYGYDFPFYKPADLNEGDEITESKDGLTKKGIKNARFLPENTILVTCIGSIGKSSIIRKAGACNQQINAIIVDEKIALPKFIFYWIKSSYCQNEMIRKASNTTLPILNKSKFMDVKIPITDLKNQKKIVQKLDNILGQLEKKKNKILELQNLENIEKISKIYQKQRLAKIFHGQLTENWRKHNKNTEYASDLIKKILKESKKKNITTLPNKLPKLPTSWSWISLGDIFDIKPGGTPSRSEEKYWNGDINWVSSGEVANCEIKQTKERITKLGMENSSAKIRSSGTILMAMIGQGKTRGQVAILRVDAATNQNVASIQIGKIGVIPEYVFNWLLHRYEETRILGWGGRQKAMNTQHVREIPIPLAPIEEQKQIVDVILNEKKQLNEINEQISLVKKTKEKTAKNIDNISRRILEKAFLGKLVN